MLELKDGKVLIAYGQNVSTRRLMIFDPNWLFETKRKDNFQQGLANVSHQLYVKSASGGWRGWAGWFERVNLKRYSGAIQPRRLCDAWPAGSRLRLL